jgi:hypothetical protein
LDRNWDSDRRARYWNCLSKHFVLGGHEITKALKNIYKRFHKESKKKRKAFKEGTNSSLKYIQYQECLDIATMSIAPLLQILIYINERNSL